MTFLTFYVFLLFISHVAVSHLVLIGSSCSFSTSDFIFLYGVKLQIFDSCQNVFAIFSTMYVFVLYSLYAYFPFWISGTVLSSSHLFGRFSYLWLLSAIVCFVWMDVGLGIRKSIITHLLNWTSLLSFIS